MNPSHHLLFSGLVATTAVVTLMGCTHGQPAQKSNLVQANQPLLIRNTRQMVFEGRRSGEGYFSADGELMIFQSERSPENPFYQMYIRDLKSNRTERVSPGSGKTTCGWIAPNKKSVIFSSTHHDPKSVEKQNEELRIRAAGDKRRYSWDYDPEYEIYSSNLRGKNLKNLTRTRGYDAEGSISPDGRQIVFASNRLAYTSSLSQEDSQRLERDPSYFMDLYIMDIDGQNVRQLTHQPGYDGGPFFSPDGQRIVWRRFSPDGHTAEIHTIRVDGRDEKPLTRLKAMSWAPFYHPSGDYIIFTTSVFGHQNFELFVVDVEGRQAPVRVTDWDGFDGLPVFTPDGQSLTWNRKISENQSHIMIASWDDELARNLLNLPAPAPKAEFLKPTISQQDLEKHLRYLASKEMRGRATGSPEEKKASSYITEYFSDIGLAGPVNGGFTQSFNFTQSATLGMRNELVLIENPIDGAPTQRSLLLNQDWRPMGFSQTGEFPSATLVFAGYGIKAPKDGSMPEYDSYKGLDVKDKWVIVLRYAPEDLPRERSLYLQRFAKLEHKAILARDLGAKGLIFVTGPTAKGKDSLIPFRGLGGTIGIPALSVSDEVAKGLFESAKVDLKTVQKHLDKESDPQPISLANFKFSSVIDVRTNIGKSINTLGLLKVPGATRTLVIGAHGDHLGDSASEDSLMNSSDSDSIHYGADDNASGVSAVLELAHSLTHRYKSRELPLKQNILFAVWSGEELGNLGSSHFLRQLKRLNIKPSAYINLDMVGRWKESNGNYEPLSVQGLGSSTSWAGLIESLNPDFPIGLQNDPYLPTDAMAFYLAKVPIISFFSGVHTDYHTPRDTADKINYRGLEKIALFIEGLGQTLAKSDSSLPYSEVPRTQSTERRGFRIYLGTIPDYSQTGAAGLLLSGVVKDGPADKAGLKSGDIIVEFSNKKISNMQDYVFTLETIRPNEPTKIVVMRNGRLETIDIVPLARE
jgi:Tol biopolymer transport system component